MKICQLSAEDIEKNFEALFELKCRSLKMSFRDGECDNLEITCRKKLLELPDYVKEEKAVVFGAFENEELKAFLWAYPRTFFDQPRMFINGVAVQKELEGQGIAKLLVHALKQHAADRGCVGIDLTVAPFNEKAMGFYRHLGFEDERIQMVLTI